MKKVIAVDIVELMLFDTLDEMYIYIEKLKTIPRQRVYHWHRETDDGKILLCISRLIRKEDTERTNLWTYLQVL